MRAGSDWETEDNASLCGQLQSSHGWGIHYFQNRNVHIKSSFQSRSVVLTCFSLKLALSYSRTKFKKGGGLREPLLDSGNQFVKKKKKKKLSVSIQNGNVSYQLVVLIDIVLLQRIKFAATEQEKPRSYKTHKSTSLLQSSVLKQRRLTCVMQSCIADSLLHTSQQQRDTCLTDPTLKIWN